MQVPWRAGTGPSHKCTGRSLCLLHTFLLPSSFCNNNNNKKKKLIKKKKPQTDTFKPAASKTRAGCGSADAGGPLEAGGLEHLVPAGTLKDTGGSAASPSRGRFGNGSFGSRNRSRSPPRSQGEGGSHTVSDHSLSFLYTLWLLI